MSINLKPIFVRSFRYIIVLTVTYKSVDFNASWQMIFKNVCQIIYINFSCERYSIISIVMVLILTNASVTIYMVWVMGVNSTVLEMPYQHWDKKHD